MFEMCLDMVGHIWIRWISQLNIFEYVEYSWPSLDGCELNGCAWIYNWVCLNIAFGYKWYICNGCVYVRNSWIHVGICGWLELRFHVWDPSLFLLRTFLVRIWQIGPGTIEFGTGAKCAFQRIGYIGCSFGLGWAPVSSSTFIHWFIHLFIHEFIDAIITVIHAFIHEFTIRSFVYLNSFIHSFIHSFIRHLFT